MMASAAPLLGTFHRHTALLAARGWLLTVASATTRATLLAAMRGSITSPMVTKNLRSTLINYDDTTTLGNLVVEAK